ncbi:dihydroneopterin aldolase [Saccharibacillus kuerlensis]|uniref:7,8-dihydroneopterin aldolase n=1 Tax=Saccharibacillus kuerlensis TaxID=459527 RepID=A0ABQ2LBA6_9BACL|nr:dihydroneopterin aldolase [Saccharibacillus kuerlensis]GGO09285.1 dihydroneopterin aldolase [Saccharibacillus kuerlensis]
MDKMIISRMEYYGRHGVFEEERRLGQRFYVGLELELDLSAAGLTDDLEQAVNYAEVHETVKNVVEGESVKLIETLAERIASAVLRTYTRVEAATVKVTKPHPPFDIHFEGVTVEIRRSRKRDHNHEKGHNPEFNL